MDLAHFELKMLYAVWCLYPDVNDVSDASDVSDFMDFSYITLEWPTPIPCSLPWLGEGATGLVVCSGAMEDYPGFTLCIESPQVYARGTCGCCGGKCPKPCIGTACKLAVYGEESAEETGVWLVDVDGGYAQCVISQ